VSGRLSGRVWYRVSSASRDSEIGLFSAWDARCIADESACDLAIELADNTLDHYQFDDYEGISKGWWVCDKTPEDDYCGNLSFSHYPNLFFLPFLLTGNTKYIKPQEDLWAAYQKWSQRAIDSGIKHQNGRNLAWNLRTLVQLAWLQQQGLTEKTVYIQALEKTRISLLEQKKTHYQAGLHVLGTKINTDGTRWTGWMESYLGQVINYVVQLGFEEWRPIAEWHFQHLEARCGGEWPLKYCGNDHVKSGLTWADTNAYSEDRANALEDWPDDQLPTARVKGVQITYPIRAQNARAWAAMAAMNNINGAEEMFNTLNAAIDARGDTNQHQEFSIGIK